MAKKILSIVLSVLFIFSTFAICSFAGDTITDEDRERYPAEELAVTDPKERIDRSLLTGRTEGGVNYQATAASKDVLEDNLNYWKQEIIDEYHALEAKGDAATDEEWGALYRKMKTPHNNDWDNYGEFWYEYKDMKKGNANAKFVVSKDEVQPGEEFTVDLYLTTDFWFNAMYATIFYNNSLVDVLGCSEYYRGTKKSEGHEEDIKVHPLGEDLSKWDYLEINHYGDYDVAQYGDMRDVEWPDTIKNEKDAFNKYEGYTVAIYPEASDAVALKADNTKIITFKFKAKTTATAGEVSPLFCTDDANYTLDKLDVYDQGEADNKTVSPCWLFYRCDKESRAKSMTFVDQLYLFDKNLHIESTSVKIAGGAEEEKADYTALDAAINGFNSSLSRLYTKDSWNRYATAVTAASNVSRDLLKADQAIVDNATAGIESAKNALVLNSIVSADVVGTPTIGSDANVQVVVNGSPNAIRLVGDDENALTFERANAVITADGDNEIWSVKVAVSAEKASYTVYAKWGDEFNNVGTSINITATEGADLSIHSISIPDMYPTGTYMDGKISAGKHDVIVRTSKDVFKIQFIDPQGNTRTYDQVMYTPVVDGDELVWTLPHSFAPYGIMNLAVRTRAANTTFALTGDYITGKVVY